MKNNPTILSRRDLRHFVSGCAFVFCGLIGSLSAEVQAQKNKLIPVLIVDGFSNHDWKQTTAVTKWILEGSGLFKVEVSTIPADSVERLHWLPAFKNYLVVIQNTNNIWEPRLRWPAPAERALEVYVKKGGGLYILHSANNAFPHWKEYDKMIGLGWRPDSVGYALEIDAKKNIVRIPPGSGIGTGHGDRFDALIQILNRHPINNGYPDQWQTANTEVYYFPRGPAENLTVLSYAYDSTRTHKMWPVEWVVSYGEGRVYNSSMGHLWKGETYPPAYRCVGYQTTVIRAAEWLATGNVTYPVPQNFPTKTSLSLNNEDEFIKHP
ncbi:MAG TPA: ThuA domain-containing protein [Cyclobacteriaceae bacterium]|nr:ThuA domain-containing protein [Cyclobacteriaceae bacterium]